MSYLAKNVLLDLVRKSLDSPIQLGDQSLSLFIAARTARAAHGAIVMPQ
jgi:hypothetical protein